MRAGRLTVTVAAILVVIGGTTAYVVTAATDAKQSGGTEQVTQAKVGDLLFVDLAGGQNRVEKLADGGARTQMELACQRFYAARRHQRVPEALRSRPDLRGRGEPRRQADQDHSASGHPEPREGVAVRERGVLDEFVTGDSYSVPGGFSTRTGYFDVRAGETVESLEHFAATVEGAPLTASDANYWGLTVGSDDRTFYATLASGGFTWLVKGDLVSKSVTSLRRDAECPSLSPDGTKVAYKKRIGRLGRGTSRCSTSPRTRRSGCPARPASTTRRRGSPRRSSRSPRCPRTPSCPPFTSFPPTGRRTRGC